MDTNGKDELNWEEQSMDHWSDYAQLEKIH